MATGRLPDPNSAPVTSKGDLYTYSTRADRLAVGNNGDTLVADSSASTGLRWTATPSASNPVLNSSFDIWQRGTSISVSASSTPYTADRWQINVGANQASTVSRQATNDTTNLPNIQYCARVQRNSGQTGTGNIDFVQSFESSNSIPFAGKVVTLSFYARSGANYSPTSSILNVYLISGTGTDQNRATGFYTGEAYPIANTGTSITSTWTRYSFTSAQIGATATELAILLRATPTGTAGANDWFEVTGVQIDIGNVALPYRRNSATLAGELAACQRYYYRISPTNNSIIGLGWGQSTTVADFVVALPVTLRAATTTLESGNLWIQDGVNGYSTGTLTIPVSSQYNMFIRVTFGTATLTQFRFYSIQTTSSAGYLAISAEL